MQPEPVQIAHRTADELFDTHAGVFGEDLAPYHGHVHRVIGLTGLQAEVAPRLGPVLGVAAFYHDAAIWFDGTWDYLPGSIERAVAENESTAGRSGGDAALIEGLIGEHHRIRRSRHDHPMVEAFRLADRYDLSWGMIPASGVTRASFRSLVDAYPNAGFRRMLVRAFGKGLRENPRRPLPMLKV